MTFNLSRKAQAALVTTVLILAVRPGMPQESRSQATAGESGAAGLWLVHCDNDKAGFIDRQGKLIIECSFDDAHEFSNGLAAVAVLDPLAPPEARSVDVPEEPRLSTRLRWGFIDEAGTTVVPPQFPFVQDFSENMAAVQKDGKWGFIDKNGALKVPPRYDEVGDFHEGVARVEIGHGRTVPGWSWLMLEAVSVIKDVHWGFIDHEGTQVIPADYSWLSDFHQGLASFREGVISSWPTPRHEGHIDHNGVRVTGKEFDYVGDFGEGLARVIPKYKGDSVFLGDFSEGLALITRNDKRGYIDRTGKAVIKAQFERAGNFSEGLAAVSPVRAGGKWGYIDKTGEVVIPAQFDQADQFHEGLAIAVQGAKYGFIARDGRGRWAIQPQYDRAQRFRHGLARVGLHRSGLDIELMIDPSGRCVWNCRQADTVAARSASAATAGNGGNPENVEASNLFMVRQGDKTCYISRSGAIVIPCEFEDGHEFSEGLTAVAVKSDSAQAALHSPQSPQRDVLGELVKNPLKWGFINAAGQFVIPARYDAVHNISEGFAAVRMGSKWGFIDRAGRPITRFVYDRVEDFKEGRAAVQRNWPKKLIDQTGAEVADVPNLSRFSDGLAAFVTDTEGWSFGARLFREAEAEKVGYYGPDGKVVIKQQFKGAGDFHEGLARAKTGDKWGYIDHAGHFVLPEQFQYACAFSEGLAGVSSGGKLGFTDRNGQFVIPAKFDWDSCESGDAFVFSEGLALVPKDGKFGYIDRRGEFVIPPSFDHGTAFRRGVAHVHQTRGDSQFDSLIDKSGHCFWNCP